MYWEKGKRSEGIILDVIFEVLRKFEAGENLS